MAPISCCSSCSLSRHCSSKISNAPPDSRLCQTAADAQALAGLCRYIWLPLWVVDIPQGEEDFPSRKVVRPEDRARMRQRFRSMRPGPASLKEVPPIDVVVR